jgi:MscS family membrane protein
VTVPNKQMVDSIVDNMSMRSQRRAEIKLELSEKTNAEDTQKFIESVSSLLTGFSNEILKNSVFLTEFGKNGVTVTIEYFTVRGTMSEFNKLKQDINFGLMKLMAEAKIELASGSGNISIFQGDPNSGMAKNQPLI